VRFGLKLVLISVLSITPLFSGNSVIKFENFFTVSRVGTPVVSIDGQKIAFTVNQANINENNYKTQIWVMNANGEYLKQLTSHSSSSSNPVFSSDGNMLYFLSSRSGSSQIWKIALSGGDAQQVSDIYGDIDDFILSPDGSNFVLVRKVIPGCETEDCIRQMGEAQKNNPVKARVIDNLMYRHWNIWLEGQYSHLFLLSLDGKTIKDLTPGPYHVPPISLGSSHDYSFSPDGTEISYVTNMDEEVAISTNNDLFSISIQGSPPAKVSFGDGNDNNPQYSPDGKYIAYSSMGQPGFEADRQRIILYNRETKKSVELTAGFTLSVGEIVWSVDSKIIYFTAEEAGNNTIYKISLSDSVINPVLKGHNVSGLHFLNENMLVFSKQTNKMPFEIYSFNVNSKTLSQLTHFNDEILKNFDLPDYEEFWFSGAEGDSVQGFIMKPPLYEEGKKYPAIHLIHGGPQGMWSNEWHFRWNYQMFASPGYVVYYINFHGSRGYGQAFTNSISKHWGDLPYEDLRKATEYVIKHYDFVDPNRLGAAGASYGGFMINWIAGHENPYKCLVSHDGVYDQVSMWGSTEELWFPEWEMGGVPWQAGTVYGKWSPSRLAANFKTPTLVIHGEHDYRVPYTQGLQFFTALQRQDVPSRLLFFPDEDHFVRKPKNAQLWWKTVHEWFDNYLGQTETD
jgi:dipeptidyl aminopeptidase/acylaminoacyl peptidase